jgi:hypothetical protein
MRWITGAVVALSLCVGGVADAEAPQTLQAAFDAALSRSPTPLSLRRDQAAYLADRAATPDADQRASLDEGRQEQLLRLAEVDLNASTAAARLEDLPTACIDIGALEGCTAGAGGWVTAPNAAPLFWQTQAGWTGADGTTVGIVFLTAEGGLLKPVAWASEGAGYDAPVVFDQDGVLYVAVPGITHGGRGDNDLIFRWTPGAEKPLQQIDSWSWRDDLAALLPGLSAYGRIRIDYVEQVALVELWREGDPGCCGTGGHALVDFAIADGRLKAVEAKLRDR